MKGQDIVVQIDKEERGNKGAALTTYVSLAGPLHRAETQQGAFRRRVAPHRRRGPGPRTQVAAEIDVPDGMSVILRTAGIDRSAEELSLGPRESACSLGRH